MTNKQIQKTLEKEARYYAETYLPDDITAGCLEADAWGNLKGLDRMSEEDIQEAVEDIVYQYFQASFDTLAPKVKAQNLNLEDCQTLLHLLRMGGY